MIYIAQIGQHIKKFGDIIYNVLYLLVRCETSRLVH